MWKVQHVLSDEYSNAADTLLRASVACPPRLHGAPTSESYTGSQAEKFCPRSESAYVST